MKSHLYGQVIAWHSNLDIFGKFYLCGDIASSEISLWFKPSVKPVLSATLFNFVEVDIGLGTLRERNDSWISVDHSSADIIFGQTSSQNSDIVSGLCIVHGLLESLYSSNS